MKNELSLTAFLEGLGCRLRIGYYWSAVSEDHTRVIFTIWSDQLHHGKYELWPNTNPLPIWTDRPGAHELQRHIPIALSGKAEVLGVLCHPKDIGTDTRTREYYDEKSLLVLKLEDVNGAIFATVIGEASVNDARNGSISGRIFQPRSAHDDLVGELPDGVDAPDKFTTTGSAYRRDTMVREFVIKRAQGKCEYCNREGFLMANGQRYLEAHHIVSLSANGPDKVTNVIALCPEHHRQAHFGADAEKLNQEMLLVICPA